MYSEWLAIINSNIIDFEAVALDMHEREFQAEATIMQLMGATQMEKNMKLVVR